MYKIVFEAITVVSAIIFVLIGSFTHIVTKAFSTRFRSDSPQTSEFIFSGLTYLLPLALCLQILCAFNVPKLLRKFLVGFMVFVYFLEFCLNLFRYLYKYEFDFNFIAYNIRNFIPTLVRLYSNSYLLLAALLCFVAFVTLGFYKISLAIKLTGKFNYITLLILVIMQIIFAKNLALVKTSYDYYISNRTQKSASTREYLKAYYENIAVLKSTSDKAYKSTDLLPKSLFLLQLESLNALTINPSTTPNLYRLKDMGGVLFKNVQSAGIMTIYSQESVICSALPSLLEPYANSVKHGENLNCLPNIMRKLGYKTFYLQGFDLEFSNTVGIMQAAGYDFILNEELFDGTHKNLLWGYEDQDMLDVATKFIDKYTQENPNQKIFVHIVLGSTNHFPFWNYAKLIYPEMSHEVPFKEPTNVFEKVSNTTYMQDKFTAKFIDWYDEHHKDDDLLVFGDHSWPVGIHEGNIFVDLGAYQENFVTSGLLLSHSPKFKEHRAQVYDDLISELDFVPTLLGLYDVEYTSLYGQDIFNANYDLSKRCLFSAQPYAGRYVSLIKYPFKYLYHGKSDTLTKADLLKDPLEVNPEKLLLTKTNILTECISLPYNRK